jgi:uncharacterized protein YuzE
MRDRPDRKMIKDEWIQFTVDNPVHEERQRDGRIRRWARIDEAGGKFLRVILLEDGETIHNAFFDRLFRRWIMKIRYFPDTDTAYLEFSDSAVSETKDINENILIDLDKDGNLVGMTIEHAKAKANIPEFSYQEVTSKTAY